MHAQRQRRVRRGGGTAPSPPRGEAARETQPGKASAESVRCVTKTNGGVNTTEVGPGSAPLPLPHTAIGQGG